jgi:hypothetical protein
MNELYKRLTVLSVTSFPDYGRRSSARQVKTYHDRDTSGRDRTRHDYSLMRFVI